MSREFSASDKGEASTVDLKRLIRHLASAWSRFQAANRLANVVNRWKRLRVRYPVLHGGLAALRSVLQRTALDAYQPCGAFENIGPMNTYVSRPFAALLGILLLLPDGFGLAQHNFILADQLAAEGCNVIIPGGTYADLVAKYSTQLTEQVCL